MLKKLIHATFCLCLVTLSVAYAETAIEISDPWVRTAPPSAKVMAGYMKLTNHSQQTITLSDISSPQFDKVEVHRSVMHNGMMHMERIEPLSLESQQELVLEPGGYHLMLIKPLQVITKNEKVHFNLSFDNGDKLSLMAEVRDGEEQMGHGNGHHH